MHAVSRITEDVKAMGRKRLAKTELLDFGIGSIVTGLQQSRLGGKLVVYPRFHS